MDSKPSWIGFNTLPIGETSRARALARLTAPLMVGVALLAMPSFYFEDLQSDPLYAALGVHIDTLIFVAFSLETSVMAMLCHSPGRYLAANWLKLLIVAATGLALLSAYLGRFPAVHLLHLAYIGLLFIWLLGRIRRAFPGNVIPYALLLGAGTILAAGIGFFLFEPTVRSYGEGIWLAFTTAATIGYGDYVPTTAMSRMLAVVVVVVGYAVFSLVTAGIAALFVGAEEKQAQNELHSDIRSLRGEVRQLRRDLATVTPIRKCGSAHGRGIRMTHDIPNAPHIERRRKAHSLKNGKPKCTFTYSSARGDNTE